MAIPLVIVVKLPFIHWFKYFPLLWPFILYLPVSRRVSKVCNTLSTASSLLAFRLRRILAGGVNGEDRGLTRMERAVQLFCREVFGAPADILHNAIDEVSLHIRHIVPL